MKKLLSIFNLGTNPRANVDSGYELDKEYEVVYKNHFGNYNTLITKSIKEKTRNTTFSGTREIFSAHIWINDGLVVKCHAKNIGISEGDRLTGEFLEEKFKIQL